MGGIIFLSRWWLWWPRSLPWRLFVQLHLWYWYDSIPVHKEASEKRQDLELGAVTEPSPLLLSFCFPLHIFTIPMPSPLSNLIIGCAPLACFSCHVVFASRFSFLRCDSFVNVLNRPARFDFSMLDWDFTVQDAGGSLRLLSRIVRTNWPPCARLHSSCILPSVSH